MTATTHEHPLLSVIREMRADIQPQRPRSRVKFMETEVIVPDGPFAGSPFRFHRQPVMRLFVELLDTEQFKQWMLIAGAQSGKTLCAYIGLVEYHLFEIGETVVLGVPDWHMADDKWSDLRGPIMQTRFADLVPTKGPGSRGGHLGARTPSVRFNNGAVLRFMSGGGSDASKSGFTARVVLVTEADKLGKPKSTSDEAPPLDQMRARTLAFGDNAMLGMETTVTVEDRPGWSVFEEGTGTRAYMPCPHCGQYVALDRENLVGWQDAETELDAKKNAAWACSACGERWTEKERADAAQNAVAAHRGQMVDGGGEVTGEAPRTEILSFRLAAVDNLFIPPGVIAVDEWRIARLRESGDDQGAAMLERNVLQFKHCLPSAESDDEVDGVAPTSVARRMAKPGRGVVPDATSKLAIGVDVGKYTLHWVAMAVLQDGSAHVVAYGRPDVPFDESRPIRAAIRSALLNLFDDLGHLAAEDGGGFQPDAWAVDCGAYTDDVHAAVHAASQVAAKQHGADAGRRWFTITGLAETQYREPRRQARDVRRLRNAHISPGRSGRRRTISANVDAWSDDLHRGLMMPLPEAGGSPTAGLITLHDAGAHDHIGFAKHMASEERTTEFREGRGLITRWLQRSKDNHWRDAAKYALIAATAVGAVFGDDPAERTKPKTRRPITHSTGVRMPDNRSFFPGAPR